MDRAQADLLVEAIDNAPTSLSLSDRDGRLVYGNRQFWELFGHAPDTELRVADLTRPDDTAWTEGYLDQLISGERDRFHTIKRFVRADGSEFDGELTIQAIRDDTGCTGMIASVEPVDLRPKIDDARIRRLLEHAPGTMSLVGADGQLLETSGRYRTTLGYPAEFWENRTIFDILVPEDVERVVELQEELLAAPGREVTGDFRVVAADRTIEILEVTATNLTEDPDVRGVLISSRNVTAERADRRAVEAQHDDAVAQAERRSSLLATVSHELRNPLHAMSGMAELLASDPSLTGEQHDLAAAIERQLIRLAEVTDDLLDAARVDIGEFRLDPAPVDLRDLIDDVARTARSAAGDRLMVTQRVDEHVPYTVVADGTRLQQILGNLLGNAVKFTENGAVSIDVTASESNLHIEVTDTGAGIAQDDLDRIFRAFTTLPGSGDRRGAGLGLAIVRRLVGAMGGEITVDSTVGRGTTFEVRLPLVVDEVDGRLPDHGDVAEGDRSAVRRILVIEDTPVNQDLARAQLTRLGMEPVIVGSAEDGIEALASPGAAFDAVLMDHQLPGMNGREATRLIRERGDAVPIIGVTASSTAADERACLDAGMDAFLPKPVGLERLRAALDDVLGAHGASQPAASTSAAAAGLDRATLDSLADELGDRAIVEQLVRSFLDELSTRSDDIANGDDLTAARQAHTLKSSAALLGATALAEACVAAEHEPARRRDVVELAAAARADFERWLADEHRLP